MYYRKNHTRHTFKVKPGENWEVSLVQSGKCPEAKEGMEIAFKAFLWAEKESMLTIPEVSLFTDRELYVGRSGCRDYCVYKKVTVWYEELPGTTVIRECRTPRTKIPVLYVSMKDKLNSGFSITPETFWEAVRIYGKDFCGQKKEEDETEEEFVKRVWEDFRCFISEEDLDFLPVEDVGKELNIGCRKVKVSPDFSFFLWENENRIHKIHIGESYTFFKQEAQLVTSYLGKIKEAFASLGILVEEIYRSEEDVIRLLFLKTGECYNLDEFRYWLDAEKLSVQNTETGKLSEFYYDKCYSVDEDYLRVLCRMIKDEEFQMVSSPEEGVKGKISFIRSN